MCIAVVGDDDHDDSDDDDGGDDDDDDRIGEANRMWSMSCYTSGEDD